MGSPVPSLLPTCDRGFGCYIPLRGIEVTDPSTYSRRPLEDVRMKDPGFLRAAASAAARVTELTVSVVLGTWVGSWLDETLGTTPWLLLLGVCLGTAVGLAAPSAIARRLLA